MGQIEQLEQLAKSTGCEARRQEFMNKHTTFKIGGPAELFLIVHSEKTLQQVMSFSAEKEIPCLLLGNGSNMLVSDRGIAGAVISFGEEFKRVEKTGENILIAGAGAPLSALCRAALQESLTGIEFLWGIPGSVGGAAFMNAGAYGGEIGQTLVACRHVTSCGEPGVLKAEEMELTYRHTAYCENGAAITEVTVALKPGDREEIRHKMDELYSRRKEKQPLEYPSAGSVFKRPAGNFAGTLIEKCGLKGRRIGGAMVSEKHAGFIVNCGGATCKDVLDLIELIQKTVYEQTQVTLECEVKRIGR